jgi:hypothetical protein
MANGDGALVRLKMLQTVNALVGGSNQRLVAGEMYEVAPDAVVVDLVRGRYAVLVEDDAPAGPDLAGPETASVQPGAENAALPRGRRATTVAKRG